MAIKTIKPGPGKPPKKMVTYKATTRKAVASDTVKPAVKPIVKKSAPKASYTAKDSANFEGVGKRFDKDLSNFKRLYMSKDVTKQDSAENSRQSAIRRADTMVKNPYYPTFEKRTQKKKK